MMTTAAKAVYQRPWLYRKQLDALFCRERYAIVEATTKSGKTVGCMAWLTEQALIHGGPGRNYWWIAPIFAQAKIPFRRIKRGLPEGMFVANETELTLTLPNGAVLWFKGADKPDSLYGEDVYAAVIDEATRCFIAGTPVDTPDGPKPIESLYIGDEVLNASGVGHIRQVVKKNAKALAVVMLQEYTMVSSVSHRYLTQRGWVEAQHLEQTDYIITQREAMRILQEGLYSATGEAQATILQPSMPLCCQEGRDRNSFMCMVPERVFGAGKKTTYAPFLWAELFREMENEPTRSSCEGTWAGNACQGECESYQILGAGYPTGRGHEAGASIAQFNGCSRDSSQSLSLIETHRTPPKATRREWDGVDGSASATSQCSRADVSGRGVSCDWSGPDQGGASNPLSRRSCRSGNHVSGGDRRKLPQVERTSGRGSTQGPVSSGARVDRVEILQSGDTGFAVYSGGSDTVNLYDLAVSGHPSFSVNGFLVHNCKEEAWHAIRTTLTATRGPIRIIGNVKGRKNWAYRMARKAEAGEPDMHYAKITAYDAIEAGILSADEVEDAKRQLPEAVFRELYLADPSDDEGNPFGIDAIRKCVAPLSDAQPKGWGWDLAKSIDWTVGIALDPEGHACRFERFQQPWHSTVLRIRSNTLSAPALVDSTGVGDPIVEELRHGGGNYEGYKFSQTSKQQLMEGVAVAIQQQRITFPDGPIRSELESFEYIYSRSGVHYSAPEGMHDDCVCALALAWHSLAHSGRIAIVNNPFYR